MRQIRVTTLIRLLHRAVNVLLAAAVATLVFTWGHPVWSVLTDAVIIFSTIVTIFMQRRGERTARELGHWEERQYVMGSMLEAMNRDMSASEWAEGYMDRLRVEAQK